MILEDYRAIPLEVLRDFALTQSEITSIRKAADDAGVSRSAFQAFIHGRTAPQPRLRRLMGLWYLRKKNEPHDMDVVRPYVAALSVLLSAMPETYRPDAEAETVASLCTIYERRELAPPRWLELLAG